MSKRLVPVKVHYPGLISHPDHKIATEQMRGFGGVVSFEIKGGLWDTAAFIDSVKLPYIAPSLGSTESLIEQPTVISYWDQVLPKTRPHVLTLVPLSRSSHLNATQPFGGSGRLLAQMMPLTLLSVQLS